MMKILNVCYLVCLCSSPLIFTNVKERNPIDSATFSATKMIVDGWKDCDQIKYLFSLSKDEKVYSVLEHSVSKGYFILKDNVISVIYSGKYVPKESSDLSFLNEETMEEITTANNPVVKRANSSSQTIAFSNLQYICNPQSLFKNEIYSQSAARYITNCPEYYNYSYGPVFNGCAPTTGAMLMSFYDRYSSYDLVNGLLPLNHKDDKVHVDELIVEMAKYMKTTDTGTTNANEQIGLQNYLNDHGCHGFNVDWSSSYTDYSSYILASNNPAFVSLGGHAVLGIGFASIRGTSSVNDYLITHYDSVNYPGNYYVESSKLKLFFYVSK